MTLEAWVNPAATSSTWRDVVYKGNDNYYLMGTTDRQRRLPGGRRHLRRPERQRLRSAVLPANTWTHLAATYDGATLRFYVNGALVGSQAATGPISTSTNPLQIGGDSLFGQYFNGLIDEVRVYSTRAVRLGDSNRHEFRRRRELPDDPRQPRVDRHVVDPGRPHLGARRPTSPASPATGGAMPGRRLHELHADRRADLDPYTDTAALRTRYTYRVRAIDAAGLFGPYSDTATAWTGLQISPRQVALTPGADTAVRRHAPRRRLAAVNWSVDGIAGGTPPSARSTSGRDLHGGNRGRPACDHRDDVRSDSVGDGDRLYRNYPGTFTHHNDNLRTGAEHGRNRLDACERQCLELRQALLPPAGRHRVCIPAVCRERRRPEPGHPQHCLRRDRARQRLRLRRRRHGRSRRCGRSASSTLRTASRPSPHGYRRVLRHPDRDRHHRHARDRSVANTLYVVVATKEVVGGTTKYPLRLHALDLSTGAEKFGGPVLIQATVPGHGSGLLRRAAAVRLAARESARSLLLLNGVVYFSFSSHGDYQAYHGWVFGYDAKTLQQKLVFA